MRRKGSGVMAATTRQFIEMTRSYIAGMAREQQDVIDSVPVFSKRYTRAVDEPEEIGELLAAFVKLTG